MNDNFPAPCTPKRSDSTHAYAIVTSSPVMLARSNSTNTNLHHHSFSPTAQSKPKSLPFNRHSDRAHRHTRSLTALDTPPPMPVPSVSATTRSSRPYTQTSDAGSVSDSDSVFETGSESSCSTCDPPVSRRAHNPQRWSPIQLSDFFISQELPDLASWCISHRITGRDVLNFAIGTGLSALDVLAPEEVETLLEQANKLRLSSKTSSVPKLRMPLVATDTLVDHPIDRLSNDDMPHATEASEERLPCGLEEMYATPLPPHEIKGRQFLYKDESPESMSSDPDESLLPDAPRHLFSPTLPFASSPPIHAPSAESNAVLSGISLTAPPRQLPVSRAQEEEPTVQSLLAIGDDTRREVAACWGAKVWEVETDSGATAKRVCAEDFVEAKPHTRQAGVISPIQVLFEHSAEDSNKEIAAAEEAALASPLLSIAGRTPPFDVAADLHTLDSGSQSDVAHHETVQSMKSRLAALEARIKELEFQQADGAGHQQQPTQSEVEVPQYILLAGLGVCAVIGQAIVRKVFGTRF